MIALSTPELVVACAAVTLGYGVFGLIGFGANIVALPVLAPAQGFLLHLETATGYYGYTVRNIEYVKPTSVDVLNAVPGTTRSAAAGQSILTITTCSPQDGNVERLVTYAVLDSWRPRSAGPFPDLAPLMKKA